MELLRYTGHPLVDVGVATITEDVGKPHPWTLALAAEVCLEHGVTERLVSIERIRVTLQRLGVGWQRAKDWITSSDPEYERKKRDETR